MCIRVIPLFNVKRSSNMVSMSLLYTKKNIGSKNELCRTSLLGRTKLSLKNHTDFGNTIPLLRKNFTSLLATIFLNTFEKTERTSIGRNCYI